MTSHGADAATFVNVSPSASGMAGFSVQQLPTQPYTAYGPSSFSTLNSGVVLGSFSTISAGANNTYNLSDTSLSAEVSCTTTWAGAFGQVNFNDLISSDSADFSATFQVGQTGNYSESSRIASAGTSYQLAHEHASISLVDQTTNTPIFVPELGPFQILLQANDTYLLTLHADSNVSNFNNLATPTGDSASITITPVPEPGMLAAAGAVLLTLAGRKKNRLKKI